MGNLVFMLDFYRFIARYGGAHGNYGSVLSAKEDAIRWLASRTNVPRMIAEDRLFQVNDLGPVDRGELLLRADRPGSDLRFLAMLTEEDRSPITASPLPRAQWCW